MSRKPKCKFCGKIIENENPYINIIESKNGNKRREYYCNKEEYIRSKKKKVDANTDRVYYLACEIIGRTKITNTIFWKEKKAWNEISSDKIIADYLEENKNYLSNSLGNIVDIEFNRIRYLSAIIKNNLNDYKVKVERENEPKKVVNIEVYNETYNTKERRRSLDELEDEEW